MNNMILYKRILAIKIHNKFWTNGSFILCFWALKKKNKKCCVEIQENILVSLDKSEQSNIVQLFKKEMLDFILSSFIAKTN